MSDDDRAVRSARRGRGLSAIPRRAGRPPAAAGRAARHRLPGRLRRGAWSTPTPPRRRCSTWPTTCSAWRATQLRRVREDMACLVAYARQEKWPQAADPVPEDVPGRLRRRTTRRGVTMDPALERYSRQMRFYGIGEDGQRRLLDAARDAVRLRRAGHGAGQRPGARRRRPPAPHRPRLHRDEQPAAAGAVRRARRGREPAQGGGRRAQAGGHQLRRPRRAGRHRHRPHQHPRAGAATPT